MKYRGKLTLTKEIFEKLLGVPEEAQILTVEYSPIREVVTFIMGSQEQVLGVTYPTAQSQELHSIDINNLNLDDDQLKQFGR